MLPDLTLPEGFLRLGAMGWPLAACSVLALAICLERSVFFIGSWWRKVAEYERLCRQLNQYKSQPKHLRDEAISLLLMELHSRFLSGLKSLRIIGAISPMIGLLGTILGIIAAFEVIAQHPGPVSPNMIAGGLGEAMFTTSAGLMIALPSLLMAHYFQFLADRQLDGFSLKLNHLSLSLSVHSEQKSEADDTILRGALPVIGSGGDDVEHGPMNKLDDGATQCERLILNAAKLLG